jgi:hypothetical protein
MTLAVASLDVAFAAGWELAAEQPVHRGADRGFFLRAGLFGQPPH